LARRREALCLAAETDETTAAGEGVRTALGAEAHPVTPKRAIVAASMAAQSRRRS
jgi:hypothetical protein